jgi:hypothetical protein
VEDELGELAGRDEALRKLAALSGLVEEYLRDLPDLVGRTGQIREYEVVPPEGAGRLEPFTLSPERIRKRSPEEVKELERAEADGRAARLREIYEAIGLTVEAHKDGTLLLRWSFGERVLPGVTEFGSPVLKGVFSN